MSHSGNPSSEVRFDDLSDRFRDSVSCEANKPDFRELDLGSPVSPLRTRHQSGGGGGPAASSSSSSSGSVSGRNGPNWVGKRSDSGPNNHSGELSGSSESSPTAAESLRSIGTPRNFKSSGHSRSDSASNHPLIYSGQSQSSATSPSNVLPTGNICPSGRILKTNIPTTNRSSRTDVLGSGSGNYGHGSIMRGLGGVKTGAAVESSIGNVSSRASGISGGDSLRRGKQSLYDPEELKIAGNEQFKKGNFADALSLYDRAIAISPTNAAYRSNRAAALTGLGRFGEAVSECEKAVKLDPNYVRAHYRLASLFRRWVEILRLQCRF